MEQLYTLTGNREQESVAAWVKKRWRDALGNPRGTVARKWVLPTAEKQPIENIGVGVGASGQSTCLTRGALQHYKNEGYSRCLVSLPLPDLVQNHVDNRLFFDDVKTVACPGWCLSSHIAGKAKADLSSLWC